MGQALSSKHYLPNKEDRVSKPYFLPAYGAKITTNAEEFDRVEMLLDEMLADYVNGKTRSDICQKAKAGLYEHQKKPMAEQTFKKYWVAVMERLKYDRPVDVEQLKDYFYSALMSLYNIAADSNNVKDAKGVIDSMMKLTGVLDNQQQKVSIEKKENGDINISFGFSSNNEEK